MLSSGDSIDLFEALLMDPAIRCTRRNNCDDVKLETLNEVMNIPEKLDCNPDRLM